MTIDIVVSLVIMLCPKLDSMSDKYIIQDEKVNCMEYYTNDIINHPDKYKELVKYVKRK